MKLPRYIFVFLLLATLGTSCKKDDIAFDNEYDKSYKAWKNFKSANNNTYRYKTFFVSWVGFTTETTITVRDGKVVERSFVNKRINYPSKDIEILESWTENSTQLNTHQTGAATLTLDEIYQKAKVEWLLVRKNAETYFENENTGMISSCGYVENNCMDDCFVGINIAFIEKIN